MIGSVGGPGGKSFGRRLARTNLIRVTNMRPIEMTTHNNGKLTAFEKENILLKDEMQTNLSQVR